MLSNSNGESDKSQVNPSDEDVSDLLRNYLSKGKWSKYTAVFPEELVERLTKLYSYHGKQLHRLRDRPKV